MPFICAVSWEETPGNIQQGRVINFFPHSVNQQMTLWALVVDMNNKFLMIPIDRLTFIPNTNSG